MRLVKIENSTEVNGFGWIFNYIDCGEYYLLTKFWKEKDSAITLNQNATLEDLQKKYGGGLYYHKLCKNTFRVYKAENGRCVSRNIDEVMSWTETDTYYSREGFLLEALITGKGLEKLHTMEQIVRWPNEVGGRGEYWYKLLRN
jgi:hypothetical protein